jgi:MarR-like DNA-binding transcriptional regulator SgrR of sgrS sRNA
LSRLKHHFHHLKKRHHISSFSRKVKAFHHFQEKLKHVKNIQTKKKFCITFHFHHPLYINKQNKENQNTQKNQKA